jgi:formylglycine-generating enzyme required for sulfatase activity
MTNHKLTHIISDIPVSHTEEFNFDAYAKTIADVVANKENQTPLVGIYGAWGTGKTSLMQTVRHLLQKAQYADATHYRRCKTVWFQAWKYAKEDEILSALIETIFKAMDEDDFFDWTKSQVEKLTKRIKTSKIVGSVTKLLTGMDVTEFFGELEYKDKLGFYTTFDQFFDDLIWTYMSWRFKLSASEQYDDRKGVLAIFVDDLDRCPRPRIIQVLETIKLFMDKKGCVFVIGADHEIIESTLIDTYGKEGAIRFMDKIVQVTFKLPQIPVDSFNSYIEQIAPRAAENITPHLPVIMPVISHNPRQLKRFLNNVNLLEGLLRNSGVEVDFNHLLFWNMLDLVYPDLAKQCIENPASLELLQSHVQTLLETNAGDQRWDLSREALKGVPKSFHAYVQDKKLVDFLDSFNLPREQLISLCTMSQIVVSEEEALRPAPVKAIATGLGEMAPIAAGLFLYGDDKQTKTIDKAFETDIYPVTNRQFAAFIKDKGYGKDKFWSPKGLQWRTENKISKPELWGDDKWNQPEHPVVGVSYYEAEAFAKWSGKTLPTEVQWERAARSTDGRKYPWGEEFDHEKCNTKESGIEKTTRVTRYPNGISPDGCYDMAGNVWEWTTSKYDEDMMVLRGGSGASSVTAPGARTAAGAPRAVGATASVFVASGPKLPFFLLHFYPLNWGCNKHLGINI